MNNKIIKKLTVVGVSTAILVTAILYLGSEEFSDHKIPPIKPTDEVLYSFDFRTVQANTVANKNIMQLTADLRSFREEENWVSEWAHFESFILNGNDSQDKLRLTDKPTISSYDDKGITHAISPDFPKLYLGLQVSMLNKFFLPFKLTNAGEITRQEVEDFGKVDVNYNIQNTNSGFNVQRVWNPAIESQIMMDPKKNAMSYTFDLSGRLISANGTLVYRIKNNPKEIYRTDIQIKVKKVAAQMANRRAIDKTQFKSYGITDAMAEAQVVDPSRHIPSLEEIYQNIDSFNDKTSARDRFFLYSDLSNNLEHNPENLGKLVNRIIEIKDRDESSKRQASLLFSVLAGNSTQESALALGKLASESCTDEFCREQAVMAHGMHQNPTRQSTGDILNVARSSENKELAGNAYLSVGNSGKVLSNKYPELATNLIHDLNETNDSNLKTMIIKGMGNHGQKEYFPYISDSISSSNHATRSSAIFALRYVPDENVTPALMNVILHEDSDIVREKALTALSYRAVSRAEYSEIAAVAYNGDETDELTVARFMAAAYRDHNGESSDVVQEMLSRLKSSAAKSYLEAKKTSVDEDIALGNSITEEE